MKQLSIEEKARRYDEALNELQVMMELPTIKSNQSIGFDSIRHIFPELKENEEQIRKEIINYFKCQSRDEPTRKDIHNKWINWLERQDEKKLVCSEEAMKYLKENHSPSEVSDFQTAMNIAVAKAYDKGKEDTISEMLNTTWSEEDEKMVRALMSICDEWATRHSYLPEENTDIEKIKSWLQSLKFNITDEELDKARKDAFNDALDKMEYHGGKPTFGDGWSAAIWYLKKRLGI